MGSEDRATAGNREYIRHCRLRPRSLPAGPKRRTLVGILRGPDPDLEPAPGLRALRLGSSTGCARWMRHCGARRSPRHSLSWGVRGVQPRSWCWSDGSDGASPSGCGSVSFDLSGKQGVKSCRRCRASELQWCASETLLSETGNAHRYPSSPGPSRPSVLVKRVLQTSTIGPVLCRHRGHTHGDRNGMRRPGNSQRSCIRFIVEIVGVDREQFDSWS